MVTTLTLIQKKSGKNAKAGKVYADKGKKYLRKFRKN